jgi:hypothetical protein
MKPFKGKKDCFGEIPICNPIYDMAPVKFYIVGILSVMAFYMLYKHLRELKSVQDWMV